MTLEHADVSEQQPAVTIVIPAKNEAENVRPLINEIRAAMDGAFDYLASRAGREAPLPPDTEKKTGA